MENGDRATILLVEDSDIDREIYSMVLAKAGFDILAFTDYEKAVTLLESDRKVDLLLTDIVLPKVHGFALARMARVRRPTLRILYMSHYSDLPRHESAMAFGRIITKPSEPARLVEEVRAALVE
jgi:DNA-binding NtrC family response regulator